MKPKFIDYEFEEVSMIQSLDYDPSKATDEQLLDDHRICFAWAARLKAGKPFKYTKEQVRELYNKIKEEMIHRGFEPKAHLELSEAEKAIIVAENLDVSGKKQPAVLSVSGLAGFKPKKKGKFYYCPECNFVKLIRSENGVKPKCPICGTTLKADLRKEDVSELIKFEIKEISPSGLAEMDDSELEELDLRLKGLFPVVKEGVRDGLYFIDKHAILIDGGEKTLIVKSKPYNLADKRWYLCGERVYGIIEVGVPRKIDLEQFNRLSNDHRITDEERKSWWPGKTVLYGFPILDYDSFEFPKEYLRPQGIQNFIKNVQFSPKEKKVSLEDVVNAYIFLVKEMRNRKMKIDEKAPIYREAFSHLKKAVQVIKDAFGIKGLTPTPNLEFMRHLQDFVLLPDYISLTGGTIYKQKPNDIDLVIRTNIEDPTIELKFREMLKARPDLYSKFHYVWNLCGPTFTNLPLYDLVCRLKDPEELAIKFVNDGTSIMSRKSISGIVLGRPFTPPKAKSGYTEGSFFKFEDLWKFWASGIVEAGHTIQADVKYDGMRFTAHKNGDVVKIFTEDRKRDRAEFLPEIVAEIKGLKANKAIVDGEMVVWRNDEPIPRQDMIFLINSKDPIKGEEIHYNLFAAYLADNKEIKTWHDAREALFSVLPKDKKFLKRVVFQDAKTEAQLKTAHKQLSKYPGSEGIMVKDLDAPIEISGRIAAWAKLKNLFEIKCKIIGRLRKPMPWTSIGMEIPKHDISGPEALKFFKKLQTKSKTFIFRCAIRKGNQLISIDADSTLTPQNLKLMWRYDSARAKREKDYNGEWQGTEDPQIWETGLGFKSRKHGEYAYGNSYAAKADAKIGDVVTIRPVLMREFIGKDGKRHFSWIFPRFGNVEATKTSDDIIWARKIVAASPKEIPSNMVQKAVGRVIDPSETELSREEQRELSERRFGDPYLIEQPKGKTFGFVVQYHIRGIWDDEERKELTQMLDKASQLTGAEKEKLLKKIWSDFNWLDNDLMEFWKLLDETFVDKKEKIRVKKFLLEKSIWTKSQRSVLNDGLEEILKESNPFKKESLWKNLVNTFNLYYLKTPIEQIKQEMNVAMEKKENVSAVLNKHLTQMLPDQIDKSMIANKGNVHIDLRHQTPDGNYLIGYTLDTPSTVLQFLNGKIEIMLRDKFLDYKEGDNIISQRKAAQPLSWYSIVSPKKSKLRIKPGEVGATPETSGLILYKDGGKFVYGVNKSDYHEKFYWFNKNKQLNGRWGVQLIAGRAEYEKAPKKAFWMTNHPPEQTPYILTHNKEAEEQKAKKEKVKMVWNSEAVPVLQKLGYKFLKPKKSGEKPIEKVNRKFIQKSFFVPIRKLNDEKRLVYGVVLEPEKVDAQNEIISSEEIEKCAHDFLRRYNLQKRIGFMHRIFNRQLDLVESYIAPVDLELNGDKIKQGSWVAVTHIIDDLVWKLVKEGKIKGYSIGGKARLLRTT